MSRSRILIATVTAAATITLLSAIASPPAGGPDYGSMPPAPAEVFAKLTAGEVNLAKAIELAQKEVNGVASAANVDLKSGEVAVTVYSQDGAAVIKFKPGSSEIASKTPLQRFPGEPVTGEPLKTDSGLMYYEIKVGEGEAAGGPTATVTAHYTIWLTDGTEIDSSVRRGQPSTFRLSELIEGWKEGVGSMKVGGKRKLVIPANLAWGAAGRPGIPPNAMVVFDVELIAVPHSGDHTGHNH